jgi:neutral ceramidase
LVATGRARTLGGDVTYSIASASFEVTSAPLASASVKQSATALEIQALLGSAPGLRALGTGASDTNVPLPGPWTAIVTLDDATIKNGTITPASDGSGLFPLSAAELAKVASVEVRDAAGNGGMIPIQ